MNCEAPSFMIMIKVDNAISSIVYWVFQYFPILPIYIAICINLIHFPPFNIYWFLLIIHTDYTTPAYLTYIRDYIIPYWICQEVFEIFMAGVWFLWVETNASKTKNRYKLTYPSCLLKKDVEVNSLSLLSEHWFAFSKRPRCFPTFKQCQQTTTGGARCQNRTALLVPKTRVLPLHFILHITRPKSESNRQPQIKCPPCTKRRSIVTMVLYH